MFDYFQVRGECQNIYSTGVMLSEFRCQISCLCAFGTCLQFRHIPKQDPDIHKVCDEQIDISARRADPLSKLCLSLSTIHRQVHRIKALHESVDSAPSRVHRIFNRGPLNSVICRANFQLLPTSSAVIAVSQAIDCGRVSNKLQSSIRGTNPISKLLKAPISTLLLRLGSDNVH